MNGIAAGRLLGVAVAIAMFAGVAVGLEAQAVAALPRFTAVAVRAGARGQRGAVSRPRGTEFRSPNVTLRQLVAYAYGVETLRKAPPVEGGPPWADRETFTILANSDRPISISDSRLMVRALLVERFGLRIREESRDLPVYALVIAGARLGPNLARSRSDCAASSESRRSGTLPLPVTPFSERCGVRGGGLGGGELGVSGTGTLQDIVDLMVRGPEVDRPIVDRTELRGTFDVDLRWAPPRPAPGAAGDRPGLFTAVREQLGLRLDAARALLTVVVVESAERPELD